MKPRLLQCALLAVVILASCGGDGRESPGDKREWSVLQNLEFETRDARTNEIQFRTVDNYELMAVPRETDSRLIYSSRRIRLSTSKCQRETSG